MCVRVEMYVCEWRMYVYESARINYGYIYIYIYLHVQFKQFYLILISIT